MKGRVALLELVDFCLSRQELVGLAACLRLPADPVGLVLIGEACLWAVQSEPDVWLPVGGRLRASDVATFSFPYAIRLYL